MKKSSVWTMIRTAEWLTLVAMFACLSQAAASEGKFTVLNPESELPEIDIKALSPRLNDFSGKTIVIYDGRGGNEKPMQTLPEQLKAVLPKDTKLVYYVPSDVNDVSDRSLANIPAGDAAIVGHGY